MRYEDSHSDTVTELAFLPAVGATNTLLLSEVITPDQENMKRTAQSTRSEHSRAAELARDAIQHNHAKRKDVGSQNRKDCPNLKMARFWTERDEIPIDPVEFSNPFRGPAPFKIDYDGVSLFPLRSLSLRF